MCIVFSKKNEGLLFELGFHILPWWFSSALFCVWAWAIVSLRLLSSHWYWVIVRIGFKCNYGPWAFYYYSVDLWTVCRKKEKENKIPFYLNSGAWFAKLNWIEFFFLLIRLCWVRSVSLILLHILIVREGLIPIATLLIWPSSLGPHLNVDMTHQPLVVSKVVLGSVVWA